MNETEIQTYDRLARIAERFKCTIQQVLTRLENELDTRDKLAADRVRLEEKEQAKWEAEREAQKAFTVGQRITCKYLQKPREGKILRFEETRFYGPCVVVEMKAGAKTKTERVHVLANSIQPKRSK